MFELGEEGLRVAAKSGALLLFFATSVQLGSQSRPSMVVARGEISCREMSRSGSRRSKDADLTSLDHRRGCRLPASDATFVPTVTAELLLQRVVGTRQVGIVIAVKKSRPVTP